MLLYVNRYKWVVDWIFVIVRAIPLYTTFYIVSIHLMLLFIGFHWRTVCCKQTVSIHLMLLFIQFLASYDELEISFNTSHVTLYLERASDFVDTMTLFQYISCYSLSKEGIDNMKDVRSFNTSHVTLYPLVL